MFPPVAVVSFYSFLSRDLYALALISSPKIGIACSFSGLPTVLFLPSHHSPLGSPCFYLSSIKRLEPFFFLQDPGSSFIIAACPFDIFLVYVEEPCLSLKTLSFFSFPLRPSSLFKRFLNGHLQIDDSLISQFVVAGAHLPPSLVPRSRSDEISSLVFRYSMPIPYPKSHAPLPKEESSLPPLPVNWASLLFLVLFA